MGYSYSEEETSTEQSQKCRSMEREWMFFLIIRNSIVLFIYFHFIFFFSVQTNIFYYPYFFRLVQRIFFQGEKMQKKRSK
jgi:hypothetical protein